MEVQKRDPLYSDKYTTKDFVWASSLGEGKLIFDLIL
jgi:hypothetical protein